MRLTLRRMTSALPSGNATKKATEEMARSWREKEVERREKEEEGPRYTFVLYTFGGRTHTPYNVHGTALLCSSLLCSLRHTTYSTTPYNVHTRCTPYRVQPYSVFLSSVRLTWSEVRASMARRPLTAVVGLAVYMSSFWSLTRLRPFALKRSSCARWGGRRRGVIRVRRSVWSGKSSGRRKASEVGPRNVVVHPDLSSTLCLTLGLSPLSVLSLSAALLLAIMQRFGANLSI